MIYDTCCFTVNINHILYNTALNGGFVLKPSVLTQQYRGAYRRHI